MTGRTHDLAALTALTAVVIVHPPAAVTLPTVVASFFANQLGGIAPDIDQPTAPLWRNIPVAGLLGKVFGKLIGGHRFLTHSLLGLAGLGFIVHLGLVALTPILHRIDTGYVWWAFMVGALSHLVMDSLTKEGVPWLLPIPFKFGFPPLKKLRVTTGKLVEIGLIFPGLAVLMIWLLAHHSQLFLRLINR